MKWRTGLALGLAGAALLIAGLAQSPAFANEPVEAKKANEARRNYLVTFGKVTLPVSRVPERETVLEPSETHVRRENRFVRQGKALIWSDTDRETRRPDVEARSQGDTDSKGRFVQRGKATVWVED